MVGPCLDSNDSTERYYYGIGRVTSLVWIYNFYGMRIQNVPYDFDYLEEIRFL